MRAGLEASLALESWQQAAISAENLSELVLALGELPEALKYARRGVEFADRIGTDAERRDNRTTLADALHQAGHLSDSEVVFREAEAVQKQTQPQYPFLYSSPGFLYCDLLLDRVESLSFAPPDNELEQVRQVCQEVQNRATQTLEWAERAQASLLSIAFDNLTLGRVHLLEAQLEGASDFSEATEHLDQAVDGLRQARQQSELPRGLLARAALRRVQKQYREAWVDVEDAMEIAKRGKMRLFQADGLLESARLHWEEGDAEQARTCLDRAKKMIDETGYHRRDPEVEALERVLSEGAEAET